MVFNSFTFAVLFIAVWALHLLLRQSWTSQKVLLVVASYAFYAAWNPPLVLLLLISTVVDWFAAKYMCRSEVGSRSRKLALLASLSSNLGMLAVFKYGNFLLENFTGLLGLAGVQYAPPEWSIILPVGISFYTFQTLSFSIDVYRGKLDPKHTTFLDFALFVSFFPQLVAGPIVRAVDFLPQLVSPRKITQQMVVWGLVLLSLGIFQKTVLADAILAGVSDAMFSAASPSMRDAWLGSLAFSGQIFFDFAGYSTAAIGVAMCFGFALPDNFWFPYGASRFSEFWQRWHISLSSWLRDYLYISLGGNRGGANKTLRNLMLTMLLGGLWHGASWNFVLWGFLHGAALIVERMFRRDGAARHAWVWWLSTQVWVLFTWVPFRARTFADTLSVLKAMFGFGGSEHVVGLAQGALALAVVAGLYVAHFLLRHHRLEHHLAKRSPTQVALLVGTLWVTIWLAHPPERAFIYFQF